MLHKRITVKDIAREANVSIATVSLALKNNSRITDKTKQKVLRIAKKLNYVPNEIARNLASQKAPYCGFIFPSINDTFFSDILESMYSYVKSKGFFLFTYLSGEDFQREVDGVEYLITKGVAGVIIFSSFNFDKRKKNVPHIKDLENRHIPYVLIDRDLPGARHNFVGVNNFKGGQIAARHLIELGHRKFLFAYAEECPPVWERYKGFESIIKEYDGVKIKKVRFPFARSIFSTSEATMNVLPSDWSKYTAMFVVSDNMAFGILKALKRNNIKVPDDISLISFDDLVFASLVNPELTTIHYSRKQLGEIAAKILLERIENPNLKKTERILLEPELIIRESTKKI